MRTAYCIKYIAARSQRFWHLPRHSASWLVFGRPLGNPWGSPAVTDTGCHPTESTGTWKRYWHLHLCCCSTWKTWVVVIEVAAGRLSAEKTWQKKPCALQNGKKEPGNFTISLLSYSQASTKRLFLRPIAIFTLGVLFILLR